MFSAPHLTLVKPKKIQLPMRAFDSGSEWRAVEVMLRSALGVRCPSRSARVQPSNSGAMSGTFKMSHTANYKKHVLACNLYFIL